MAAPIPPVTSCPLRGVPQRRNPPRPTPKDAASTYCRHATAWQHSIETLLDTCSVMSKTATPRNNSCPPSVIMQTTARKWSRWEVITIIVMIVITGPHIKAGLLSLLHQPSSCCKLVVCTGLHADNVSRQRPGRPPAVLGTRGVCASRRGEAAPRLHQHLAKGLCTAAAGLPACDLSAAPHGKPLAATWYRRRSSLTWCPASGTTRSALVVPLRPFACCSLVWKCSAKVPRPGSAPLPGPGVHEAARHVLAWGPGELQALATQANLSCRPFARLPPHSEEKSSRHSVRRAKPRQCHRPAPALFAHMLRARPCRHAHTCRHVGEQNLQAPRACSASSPCFAQRCLLHLGGTFTRGLLMLGTQSASSLHQLPQLPTCSARGSSAICGAPHFFFMNKWPWWMSRGCFLPSAVGYLFKRSVVMHFRVFLFFFPPQLFSASRKVTASGVTRGAACGDRPFPAPRQRGAARCRRRWPRPPGAGKEGAGEGALRRDCKQRSPAGDPCCPNRGSQVRRDSRSPVARKQAEEGGCFSAEAPPNLKPDHDEAAAPCPRCRGDAVARLDVSPWVGFPCTRQRRHEGGIETELRTVPQGEHVGDHFNPPVIGDGHIHVHVRDTHIPRDASAGVQAAR